MTPRDWEAWLPGERAILCFIRQNGQVLLILKKRGLGAGKINAPGGRIEPGESPLQAAIRETQEEVGVTPLDPAEMGQLFFQFVDGYSLHCTVFLSEGCVGEPVETDEADPRWTPENQIPYDAMWEDDAFWLPEMLKGRKFHGYFHFDGDRAIDSHMEWIEN